MVSIRQFVYYMGMYLSVFMLFALVNLAQADEEDTSSAAEAFILTVLEDKPKAIIEHLAAGADVNQVTGTGQSILCAASMLGKKNAVKVLMDHGAKLKNECLVTAVINGQADIVELFLERGKNPNLVASAAHGDHLLHLAVRAAYVDVVVVLLEAGADPALKNNNGLNAHDIIRQRGEVIDLIKRLLENASRREANKD